MTPLVIILGPAGAGRADVTAELVAHAWPEGRKVRVLREVREGGVAPDAWEFQDGHAVVPAPGDEDAAILVTHGALHVIDQMEALHRALRPMQPDAVWRVARILTVVDCPLAMKHKAVEEWYRPCVHFSDAVIINRRWEVPGQWVSKFLEPYEKEFYPCLFFNLTKVGAIGNPPAVIDGEPLRLTHIFDDIDAVDEMEFDEDNLPDEPFDLVRQVDRYFARDELGRRRILVPEIGDILRQEGPLLRVAMRPLIATYAWLLARLPEAFARANAAFFGEILWAIRGKVIRRNLARAFPDRDLAWVRRIGRTSCRRTAEMALFSIVSPMLAEAELRDRIQVDASVTSPDHGLPPKGAGAVLFVPHFALMEMMTVTTLIRPELAKREWVVIYRPLDQPAAERWVRESRERFGMKLVSRREGFGRLMQAVRHGHVAAVLFDQTTQTGSLWRFLGQPCAVTELPGIIAQRFRCAARVYWAERTGFWRCRLRMEALQAADSIGLTIESNAWLERQLRSGDDVCANWLWAHDRWKHGEAPFRPLQG